MVVGKQSFFHCAQNINISSLSCASIREKSSETSFALRQLLEVEFLQFCKRSLFPLFSVVFSFLDLFLSEWILDVEKETSLMDEFMLELLEDDESSMSSHFLWEIDFCLLLIMNMIKHSINAWCYKSKKFQNIKF